MATAGSAARPPSATVTSEASPPASAATPPVGASATSSCTAASTSSPPGGWMPVTRSSVSRCRWPRVRFEECLRRRRTKEITFSPLICATTSATTAAPSTRGEPIAVSVPPPIMSTWSKRTLAPSSTSSFSTRSVSPGSTRYCLPPVFRTAYIAFSIVLRVPAAPSRAFVPFGASDSAPLRAECKTPRLGAPEGGFYPDGAPSQLLAREARPAQPAGSQQTPMGGSPPPPQISWPAIWAAAARPISKLTPSNIASNPSKSARFSACPAGVSENAT